MPNSPIWRDAPSTSSQRGYIAIVRPTIKPVACLLLGKLLWVPLHWPPGYKCSWPCLGEGCQNHLDEPEDYGYAPGIFWPDDSKRMEACKCIVSVRLDAHASLQQACGDDFLKKVLRYYSKERGDRVVTHHFQLIGPFDERTPHYAFDVRPLLERMWSRSKHKIQRDLFTDLPAGTGDPANDPPDVQRAVQQQLQQLAGKLQLDEPRRTIQ